MYKLITSIKQETQYIDNIVENCTAAPVDTNLLFEAADKALGKAIAAINAGKNPFEDTGFRDVIAGLMLLAKDTNREALNVNQKKFNLVAQFSSDREDVQKFVAQHARDSGPSLIKNLDAYVNADKDRRSVLVKKLIQHQKVWSQSKHIANRGKDVEQSIAV